MTWMKPLRYAPIGVILLLTGACKNPEEAPAPIRLHFAQAQALQQKTYRYRDTLRVVLAHEPLTSVSLFGKLQTRPAQILAGELLVRTPDSSVFELILNARGWDTGAWLLEAVYSKNDRQERQSLTLNYQGLPRQIEAFMVLTSQRLYRLAPGDTARSVPVGQARRVAASGARRWVQVWDSTGAARLYEADDLHLLATGNWNGPGRRLGMALKVEGRITTLGWPGAFLQWSSGPQQLSRYEAGDSIQLYAFSSGPSFVCFLSRESPGGSSRLHAMRTTLAGTFHSQLLSAGRYHLAEMLGIGPGLLQQAGGMATLFHYQPLQQRLVAGPTASMPAVSRVKPAAGGMLCAAGDRLFYFSYQAGPRLIAQGVKDFVFNSEDQRVYFLQNGGIYALPLGGGTLQLLMPFTENATALALLFNKG